MIRVNQGRSNLDVLAGVMNLQGLLGFEDFTSYARATRMHLLTLLIVFFTALFSLR